MLEKFFGINISNEFAFCNVDGCAKSDDAAALKAHLSHLCVLIWENLVDLTLSQVLLLFVSRDRYTSKASVAKSTNSFL